MFKTGGSTYVQMVFSKNHISKKSCFLKMDLTLTSMIFINHKCVNTCEMKSFDKITIFVKDDEKLQKWIYSKNEVFTRLSYFI